MDRKIKFDDYKFKFIRGDWFPTTIYNFGQNLKRFYDLMIELFCLHGQYRDIYLKSPHLDLPVVTEYGTVSPDLVEYDLFNNPIKIIEFKCSLHPLNIQRYEQLKSSVEAKYGDKAILECLVANYTFVSLIKDKTHITLYITLLKEIMNIKSQLPREDFLQFFRGEDILPGTAEILHKSPQVQSIDDKSLEHDKYLEIEEMLPHIVEEIPLMEEFAEENFLASEDMPEKMPNVLRPTVFNKHPWGRTENRIKYNNLFGPMNWGHKANFLMQIPPNRLVEPCTLQEIIPFLYELAETKNLGDIISTTASIYITHKPELDKIKEIVNIQAYVKTEINTEERQRIATELNVLPSRIEDQLQFNKEELINKISEGYKRSVKISKHGNPILKLDVETKEKTGVYRNKDRQEKEKKVGQTVLEEGDWFDENEDEYILKYFKRAKADIPNCQNAYQFNPSLNNLSNDLASIGADVVKKITSTRAFSSVYSYIQFYRAIIAAVPRIQTKGMYMDEGVITKHPDGYYIYLTPSPNENLSGVCVVFGCVNNTYDYPTWCNPIKTKLAGGKTYFMTKPFRVNLKVAVSVEASLGAYLGTTAFMYNYGVDLTENILWTSMWWAYARQEANMADLIYLYYKNVYNVGNFGQFELEKKFKTLSLRDVRVGTLFTRMKNGYAQFVKDYRLTEKTKPWEGVRDPLFGFTHTGWQTYLTICYLRQIFPKDDGYDRPALMGPWYRSEMEHRQWYDKSFFNSANLDKCKSLPVKKFFEELMKEEETKKPSRKKWVYLSYHPDMCYRLIEKQIWDALKEDPNINPYKSWNQAAIKTGKASKCNVPIEQTFLYGLDKKFQESIEKKNTQTKGLIGGDLTENLILESKGFKRHVEEGFLRGEDSPWNNPNYHLGDKMPSMLELTLFECIIYPDCVVLTMVDKTQNTFDKRAFFVQIVFNRNANKMWDEAFRPIVKTNQWDMILTPGMKKYMTFNKDMEKLGCKNGDMMVSKDATRFGDTYQIETLEIQIIAACGTGYLSKDEAKMLLYFAKCLKERLIIMPSENAKMYQKAENKEYLTDKDKKWVLEMAKFSDYLNEPGRFDGFIKSSVMQKVKENPCFKKPVGFTLGVFNICGSMYTAAYTELIKLIEEYLGIKNIFNAKTHSDDAHDITRIKCPEREYFEKGNGSVSKIIAVLIRDKTQIQEIDGSFYYRDNGKSIYIPQQVIGKLHLVLTLFTPRFVSQRPSLLKWGFGHANEVLQVVQFDQQVHVPLVRYASAIGKDLPGKSPGSDTYMMSGRIYDLIVNGCSQVAVATTIICLNWMISSMYGLKDADRGVNLPPEIGGYWWAIPGRVFEEGFNANEVRLQCSADKFNQRLLRYLINVDEVWAKERKPDDIKDKFVMESLGLDDDAAQTVEGGIEYRKDFRMKLNRKKKSSMGLSKILNAYRTELNEQYELLKKKTKNFKEDESNIDDIGKMERLKERWMIETQVGSKSTIQNVVSVASKYTSTTTQENYNRISPDVKIISRLGYFKRKFPNPFVPELRGKLFDLIGLSTTVVTVEEIWNATKFLASQEWKTGDLAEKGIKLIYKILGNFISETKNITISTDFEEYPRSIDMLKLKYMRIVDKRELFGIGSYSLKALAAVYDMDLAKGNLQLRDTFVIKSNPELEHNKQFAEQVQVMRSFLQGNGFTVLDIHKHFRLLSRLLTEKTFHGVAKLISEKFRFETITGQLWSYDKYRLYTSTYIKDEEPSDDNSKTDNNSVSKTAKFGKLDTTVRFDRITSTLAWGQFINPLKFDYTGKIYQNGIEFRVPRPDVILDELILNGFSDFKANQLLSSILWYHRKEKYRFAMLRSKPNKAQYVLCLKMGSLPDIWCVGNEKAVYAKKDKWFWSIYAQDYDSKFNIGNYLFTMGRLITYWLTSSSRRINDLSDIQEAHSKTDFSIFGNAIAFQDEGSLVFKYLSIYKLQAPLLADDQFVVGEVTVRGVEFKYKLKRKSTETGLYLLTPWNLGSSSSGLVYIKDDIVLIKDTQEFAFCSGHNIYVTYQVPEGNFDTVETLYAVVPLDRARFIVDTLLSAVDFDEKKISPITEDFAIIASSVREIELYLGIPITLLERNAMRQKTRKTKWVEKIKDYIYQLCRLFEFEANSPENKIRAIGYLCLIESGKNESRLVREKFEKTMKLGIVDPLTYDAEDVLLSYNGFGIDLERRWGTKGNLPIGVLKMFLSSVPELYKIASFFRFPDKLMFNNLAVDEIYMINALFCGDNTSILNLIPYLGFV